MVLPVPYAPLVGGSSFGDAIHTEVVPTFGPTIMGGFGAISATDSAPDFGPTIMGGFSAIGAADPGPGFGPMIVGGDTAVSREYGALSDELERIAAVTTQFRRHAAGPGGRR